MKGQDSRVGSHAEPDFLLENTDGCAIWLSLQDRDARTAEVHGNQALVV